MEKKRKKKATDGLLDFDIDDPNTYYLAKDGVFNTAAIKNLPFTQHILDSIFGKDKFTVVEHTPEFYNKERVASKGVAFDILVKDKNGIYIDIEIQIVDNINVLKRAREYQAHIDSRQLRTGMKADSLKDVYIIFILAFDPFDLGLPLYEEGSIILGTELKVDHGFHFIYVNAANPDPSTPLGQLCLDLFCQKEKDIHSQTLLKALQYCRSEEGRNALSMRMADTEYEITEKLNNMYARSLILLGNDTDEQIASVLGLNTERIEEIRKELEEEGKLPKK